MNKKEYIIFVSLTLIIGIGAYCGVVTCANYDKEDVFAYDYNARMNRWTNIVQMASLKMPQDQLSLSLLNLSLAKLGSMPEKMFDYKQIGVNGLLPPFVPDFTSPLAAAEVYFHLGMIRNAQRYAYEIQEAIPDFQKSGRMTKRLIETSIIKGDYQNARKLLKTLQKTIAYEYWANATLKLLENEEAINAHPIYGQLRQLDYTNDYFIRDEAIDDMVGLLFINNPKNKMAYEYLIGWCLIDKNLQKFYQCYNLERDFQYDHIPLSYQQALMIIAANQGIPLNQLPWDISPSVAKRTQEFIADLNANLSREYLEDKYANTYWLYYTQDQHQHAE